MIVAKAGGNEPRAVAPLFESASAVFAIPRLGTGNAPAVSSESG
jgi:hypothetical protein